MKELYCPRAPGQPLDVAFPFQNIQKLLGMMGAGHPEVKNDLPHSRRVSKPFQVRLDKGEDPLLLSGQLFHGKASLKRYTYVILY